MNPTQDPQQPQNVPPTPAPTPAPQPFGAPLQNTTPSIAPAPQPFAQPPVAPSPFAASNPVPPAAGYGSGTMGTPVDATLAPVVSTKKGFNKKLLIIIAAIIVVLAIAAVILIVLMKPSNSTSATGLTGALNAVKSTVAPSSQLTAYKGTAFSISYPAAFKSVDLTSSTPAGSEIARFSAGANSANDGSITTVGVAASPYSADYTRAQAIQSYETLVSNPPSGTADTKGSVFTKTTYQGFEAFKETSSTYKDNNVIANATTFFVFGNKYLYIASVNVTTADTSTVGAETDTILASLKINE